MSNTTDIPAIGNPTPDPDDTDFATLVTDMVTHQAPRVFAIVLEYGDQIDAQVIAWGMALEESAYVTTVDGKNQYLLTEPQNALKYMPSRAGTTPHLVWTFPPTTTTHV
jgi:hypothetical protein